MKTMYYQVKAAEMRLIFLIISFFFLCNPAAIPQETKSRPTRQSSLEAYSKGDYVKAFDEFSELLSAYPKDPLYLYYTGVCLVRLERDPEKAVTYLRQSGQSGAQIKNVPADASFWLGRALQQSGDFVTAVTVYEEFTALAGKKTAKEMQVPDFIEQCRQQKGKLAVAVNAPPAVAQKTTAPAKPTETVPAPLNKAPEKEAPKPLQKPGPDKTQGVSKDLDKALSDALEIQAKADSASRQLSEQEKQVAALPYARRMEEKTMIEKERKSADSLQVLALSKFDQAQASMNSPSDVKVKPAAEVVRDTAGKTKGSVVKIEKAPALNSALTGKEVAKQSAPPANPQEIVKQKPTAEAVQEAVLSVFSAADPSTIDDKKKIEIDTAVPVGLVYRIQVAVFRNPVALSYFKGLSPVFGFRNKEKDITVYYAGMFRKAADAGKALSSVRQKGFRDAFITPFMDGKSVSTERAAVLEKEWGSKPLFEVKTPETDAAQRDTVPPTLAFRVEVMRSAKPVKDDVADGMKKIAGTRGLDTQKASDGSVIYLIGRFITYESAEEFADLLKRNGYTEARVAAWLGTKEIPVETARQLFENIE